MRKKKDYNDIIDFNATNLIKSLGIQSDQINKTRLDNIIDLLKQQSGTCLQGISYISFRGLIDNLVEQAKDKKQKLNALEVWQHIITCLQDKLLFRKPAAFDLDDNGYGPYHSLAMISDYQIISDNSRDILDISNRPVPTADIVMDTINSHFYYFATEEDPTIMPFGYIRKKLTYNRRVFSNCSHFKLFKDDLLLCMALWLKVILTSDASIASIVCRYICNLNSRDRRKNISALRNDSCAQECMAHWAICNSTHHKMGAVNPGSEFLLLFIQNIQIDQDTVDSIRELSRLDIRIDPFSLNLSDFSKLKTFLDTIKVPYLLPKIILSESIEAQLEGLCQFGNCERLSNDEGFDIKFEVLQGKETKTGLLECKYIDKALGVVEAKKYIGRAMKFKSTLNMLMTFSLCDELKTQNFFVKKREKVQQVSKRTKLDNSDKMSIYSIFYEARRMKIVPLLEYDDPGSVFIIIQTNFQIPKI